MALRHLLLCATLALAPTACGSAPAAPTPATNTQTTALRSGNYTMGVSTSSPVVFGTPVACLVSVVSFFGVSGPPPGETMAFPIAATVDGSQVTVRATGPGDLGLVANFTVGASGIISGSVAGQVRDVDTGVTLSFSQSSTGVDPVIVGFNGLTSNLLEVTGPITGRVELSSTGGGRVCTGASWTVVPR